MLHHQLPIHKAAYDLYDAVMGAAKNMPRDFKALLGGKLRDECMEIMTLIFRANVARDKAPHLTDLIERLQVVEITLRYCRDKQLVPTKVYAKAIELTGSIGKQAGGWRRSALSPAS